MRLSGDSLYPGFGSLVGGVFSGSAGLKYPVIYAVRFLYFARCRKMDDFILALDEVAPIGSYKFG